MELLAGLILPIINLVFLLILCPFVFWRWLSQEKRCTTLEKGFTSARKEAKKFAEIRERCRVKLIILQDSLIFALRDYPVSSKSSFNAINDAGTLVAQLIAGIHWIWSIYDKPGSAWANDLRTDISCRMSEMLGVTTGHLATWRTEIAAAQVYLLQQDGKGRMGLNGSPRHFEDEDARELVPLKGGMRWIMDRVITGNCPFPFGPDIVHELEALIARIEALEPAPA